MSLAAICGVLFFAGLGLFVFKVSRKFAPWAFLLAGVGPAGAIASVQGKTTDVIMDGSQAVMAATVGVSVLIGIAVFAGLYLFSKMWKSSGGGIVTCLTAFLFPTILGAVGLGAIVAMLAAALTMAGDTTASLFAGLGG